jgi:prepilin-type N-terminal cleavage/methylation domain-containing protein
VRPRQEGRGAGLVAVVGGRPARGFTLVETIVVIAVLSMTVGISGLAFASLKAPREAARIRELRRAREAAIHAGRPVTVTVGASDAESIHAPRARLVLFLPDGRAIGVGVDPLTGEPTRGTP